MVDIKILSNRLTGEIQSQIHASAGKAAEETAEEIVVEVKRLMHIPGKGRIYIHGGISHQASAPGQAPAADTGDLRASVTKRKIDDLTWVAESDNENAANLEYGTHTIAPRPAWTPAAEKAKPSLSKTLIALLKKILD